MKNMNQETGAYDELYRLEDLGVGGTIILT